jgi:two-component system nitrate/nitrite response regulator NarL
VWDPVTGSSGVPVVVVGPPDLITTSVVTALRARGLDAGRGPVLSRSPARVDLAGLRPGVLVIDLDPFDGVVAVVADAQVAGWTVLVVGGDGDPARVAAAVAVGAAGHVPKSAPLDVLVGTVVDVIAGRPAMTAEERDAWLELDRSARAYAESRAALLGTLTNRELAVLDQLERGRKAAEIAAGAVVAISTVRTQIRSILLKLEVNSQERAVALYREVLRRRAVG